MPETNGNNSRHASPKAQSERNTNQAAAVDVELSTRGGPDIDPRLAKIAVLQRAIADGTYGVPAGAVAEKIVNRLLRPAESRILGT